MDEVVQALDRLHQKNGSAATSDSEAERSRHSTQSGFYVLRSSAATV